MGATKTTQYTLKTIDLAIVSTAMSHPARLRILELLNSNFNCRSVDLVPKLELSKSTVHFHIRKLFNAGLIRLEFNPNCYFLFLTDLGKSKVEELFGEDK